MITLEEVMEIQADDAERLVDVGLLTPDDIIKVTRGDDVVCFITEDAWWELPLEERPCSICGHSMSYAVCPSLKDTCGDCCHALSGCCG